MEKLVCSTIAPLRLTYITRFQLLSLRSKFIITALSKIKFTKLSGYIEENPGLKISFSQKPSICHLNLNSIAAHNFIKISLLIAYNPKHKYDIIYVCLKHILIQVQPLVITFQKFLDTILCDVTIPLTLNVEVFVFTTNRISL